MKLWLSCCLMMIAASLSAADRPWPFNGSVANESPNPVWVWDDQLGSTRLWPGQTSSVLRDIDYVWDVNSGLWCKIGPHAVRVNRRGDIPRCPCWVAKAGAPCPH
ncbi:hypothetical protein ACTSKR_13230 [Chitinibacteraceae bacterium HSL-7]